MYKQKHASSLSSNLEFCMSLTVVLHSISMLLDNFVGRGSFLLFSNSLLLGNRSKIDLAYMEFPQFLE